MILWKFNNEVELFTNPGSIQKKVCMEWQLKSALQILDRSPDELEAQIYLTDLEVCRD